MDLLLPLVDYLHSPLALMSQGDGGNWPRPPGGHDEADQRRASRDVKKAIRDFILIRPNWCEACFKPCKPEAAHYNYEETLVVRWLCRSCHRVWDIEEPKPIPIPSLSELSGETHVTESYSDT